MGMMFRVRAGLALVFVGFLQLNAAPQAPVPSPPARPLAQHSATVSRYCVTCHNERLKTAGLALDRIDLGNVPAAAEAWEKVIRKLRTGAMPPTGAPRPPADFYNSLATYLETELDLAAAAHPHPGRPVIRRINRTEYANAVRDLLGLELRVEDMLPADEISSGFDNIASVLTVSPMLMERYMLAAGKISNLALGVSSAQPAEETYTISKLVMQEDRAGEDLSFGSRGGIAVRHHFPRDGQYSIKIQLQRNFRGYIRGLGEPHQLDLTLDGARIQALTIGGERRGKSAPIFSSASMGETAQEDYEHTADEELEFRFAAQAGPHQVAVAFVNEEVESEGPLWPAMTPIEYEQYKGGDPGVASVVIGGPYDAKGPGETPSRKKILACQPTGNSEACARNILTTLARRAYRRPATPEDMDVLLSFFRLGYRSRDFDVGMAAAIERILAGPEFLFRIERDPGHLPPGTAYPISDLELATRLSFFLWSSIPDDELLNLAERGRLRDPAELEGQVRRMMADAKSKALVENFAGQWLSLRNLNSVIPDPLVFPEFDENLRRAFQQETGLFFESIVREDRGVSDLLNADYTFVNERLARHYGIPNVYGSHFRRVSLSDETRRGLLGKGSVLMATSYPNRTSPVTRGKWVLENILGTPPPPPPPDVPSLADNGRGGKLLSMRERMEEHRKNPACAGCHKLMDPLGFALENFDGLGKWRTRDGDSSIDPSGALPDGTQFQGPAGMRKALLSLRQQFLATFTERLLAYALGREADYHDAPALRGILRTAAPSDYRWSALVIGIIKSTPFQMRRSPEL
ncbi:MAG: DUF1592 domain-containing protein [Acidobacteria bacterium]|nr:DUF1592 domain-containing protein [Acidobacteriota bacterium]